MFGDKFYKRLAELQPWQQTVYTLALAERMYPNYVLFTQAAGFGDAKAFRHALEQMERQMRDWNGPALQEQIQAASDARSQWTLASSKPGPTR